MLEPALPVDENERLAALRALGVLDTPPEERIDRLTRLARRLFDVPMALVSLVDADRQWFKSRVGLDAAETPREISFCGHAILDAGVLLVPDASLDPRFHDNPLVVDEPGIRFYAGCPLRAADGSRVGTLCVIDRQPRRFDADDLAALRDLAHMAENELAAARLATTDPLTLLSNRRGFEHLAGHSLALCRRTLRTVSLLYLELARLAGINEGHGRAEGDRALRLFADALCEVFVNADVIGRVRGDGFAVLLVGDTCHDNLGGILRRFSDTIDRRNRDAEAGWRLRYRVSAVVFDHERHADPAALVDAAEEAMREQRRRRASLARRR